MELIWTRAAYLIRRGWRATVLLALLAGLSAGIAMAVAAAGRRTSTTYDRFAAYADAPDLLLNFCPPDLTLDNIDEESLQRCFAYDARDERDLIAGLREVTAAARSQFRGLMVAPADHPDDTTAAVTLLMQDPGIVSESGRYKVQEGRDIRSSDEVLLNQALADASGLSVGDDVLLTFWSAEERGAFITDGGSLHGPMVPGRVVGIARAVSDLAASPGGAAPEDTRRLYASPTLAARTPDAGGFGGIYVAAKGGDGDAAHAAIERALHGRPFNSVPALGDDEIQPTREAIRYEGHATTALGVVVALAAAAFVTQAIARQSRREWHDGPALRAIGVTNGSATGAALIRGVAIGVPAAVLAIGTAVALSALGPVGVGRQAEIDPGLALDGTVLAIGAVAVLVVVALAAAVPLVRGRALRIDVAEAPRQRAWRDPGLSPAMRAGMQLARTAGRGSHAEVGTALVSVGAAVVLFAAAACLVASFDDLVRTPTRFGATWDLSVGAATNDALEPTEVLQRPPLEGEVDRAAGITGADMDVGGSVAWVQAFTPVEGIDGVVPPPISSGRAPRNDHEIAVGAVTLRSIGASVGDTIEVKTATTGQPFDMDVVGVTIINDTFEASPGRGAVVTPDFIANASPEASADPYVLDLAPGAEAAALAAQVRGDFAGPVQLPVQQAAITNVGRIRQLPYLMAAIVLVLALASLVHALVLSIGRNRRTLGVLRSIGFTRRQVRGAVAWHATCFALLAVVVALPLGVVVGRQGWQLVARTLGVPAVPVVPALALAGVIALVIAIANVAAAYPAWRASRLSPAAALRAH